MTARIVAIALLLTGLMAPAANASFGRAQTVGKSPSAAPFAAQATNERGDRVVAMRVNENVGVAFSPAGSKRFSKMRIIPGSRGEVYKVQVAMGPTGDALITWVYLQDIWTNPDEVRGEPCCPVVKGIVARAGRRLPKAAKLVPRGMGVRGYPVLSIRDGKHYGVVFGGYTLLRKPPFEKDSALFARFATGSGRWGHLRRIDPGKADYPLALSVTRARTRIAYTQLYNYASDEHYLERTLTPAGKTIGVRDLGLTTRRGPAAVAADGSGRLFVAWLQDPFSPTPGPVHTALAESGGGLREGATVDGDDVAAAMAPNGATVVTITRGRALLVATRPPRGSLSPFHALTQPARQTIAVGIGATGDWYAMAGTVGSGSELIHGRVGTTRTAEVFTRQDEGYVTDRDIAVDGSGLATFPLESFDALRIVRAR